LAVCGGWGGEGSRAKKKKGISGGRRERGNLKNEELSRPENPTDRGAGGSI